MSERLKGRVRTRYLYGDLGQLVGEEEEEWVPMDVEAAPEFVGVLQTRSLPHGEVPGVETTPGDAVWSVYKIYEKSCIWMLRLQVKGDSQ